MEGKAGEVSNGAKRVRDESDESLGSPDAKRILLDILEDVDSGDRGPADPATGDLATVMRSFEEEIAALSPCPLQQLAEDGVTQISPSELTPDSDDPAGQSDLGYLLEASDDDLGIPPTLPPPSEEEGAVEVGLGVDEDGGQGLAGMGQLWGFDDSAPSCYDAFDFGGGFAQPDGGVAGGDEGEAFDGDLFGYADVASFGPSDFSDFSWRPESLPAV